MWINSETPKSVIIERIIEKHKTFFNKKGLFFTDLEHEEQAGKTYEFVKGCLGIDEWANAKLSYPERGWNSWVSVDRVGKRSWKSDA